MTLSDLQRENQELRARLAEAEVALAAMRDGHGEAIVVDGAAGPPRGQKRLLQTVTDNATLALFIMDEKQVCTFMNPAAEQLTGFTFAEVRARGGALHDIVHHTRPDGRPYPLCECPIDQAFPTNDREQGEEVFVHKDGHFYHVAFTASPIRDSAGQPVGTIIEVQDITERKQAEAALRESEQRLSLALDGAGAVAWGWNVVENRLDDWTPQYQALYGFGPDEPATFDSWLARVHPDDRERLLARARQMVNTPGDDVWREEFRILHPQRGERWLGGLGRCFRDEAGQALRMAGVNMDVTERKRTEEALRTSEEQYRTLAEYTNDFVSLHDVQGRHLYISPSYYRRTGWTPEDLQATDWRSRQHPDDVDRIAAAQSACAAGSDVSLDHRILCRDGSCLWVEQHYIPIRDADGKVSRILQHSFDITARKQAETQLRELNESLEQEVSNRTAALREREARTRAILDTTFSAIITIDQRGIIREVNRAVEQLFGYRQDELVGQNVRVLMPAPYCDEHDGYLARYLRTGVTRFVGSVREVIGRRRDGSTFPAEIAVTEVDRLGLFTGIIRDVSERKELQRHVLEIAAEEQRRLGYELHDGIQQELTGLSLLFGTLCDGLRQSNQPPGVLKMADRIAQGLAETNRHVVELAHGIEPVQIDGEGLRVALENLATRTAAQSSIACEFDCADRTVVADNTSAAHLYRIAQEALNNALRHGSADAIRISLSQLAGDVVLEVSDNGRGFDPEMQRSGMGLRTMEYRADLIGGKLRIEQRPQGGMLVRCLLPQAEVPRA